MTLMIKKCTLRLDEIDKMKKDIKGKRRVLDQDKTVIVSLVPMLEDENECDFIKK